MDSGTHNSCDFQWGAHYTLTARAVRSSVKTKYESITGLSSYELLRPNAYR
jgi:hypothetical protein